MADRDITSRFYKTKAWKQTRAAYARWREGLCERCLSRGEFTPGEIVHHKVHLDASNIDDPSVTLNFDNLELVCRKCHAEEHPEVGFSSHSLRRVAFDALGNVVRRGVGIPKGKDERR